MTDYKYLDEFNDEQVQTFKEEARELELERMATAFVEGEPDMGRLVAEGDSWFDYTPGTDLIDCLRKFHGYRIKNFADLRRRIETSCWFSFCRDLESC